MVICNGFYPILAMLGRRVQVRVYIAEIRNTFNIICYNLDEVRTRSLVVMVDGQLANQVLDFDVLN